MNAEGRTEAPPTREDAAARDLALGRVLDDYYEAIEAGRSVPPELLAALHSTSAGPDFVDRVARGFEDGLVGPPAPRLGDFLLIRSIGRGGMGVVFEARQLSLKRAVALKVLPFAASLDAVQLSRFLIEAQAAAKLHHANIVPVFFVGREHGMHFFAMQLIKGRTLADLIRDPRRGARARPSAGESAASTLRSPAVEPPPTEPMTPGGGPMAAADLGFTTATRPTPPPGADHHRLVAELGVQAAEALEHAHRQGVIHRDVKPSNLMLDGRGNLWITDFGLARLAGNPDLTRAGDLLGTLRYMSPEQASGDPSRVDHRTDVYSLGATLYELLTLRPVRAEQDRDELLGRLAAGEIRPPRAWNRSIPRDLETIVLRALSHDPGDRYATARGLADDLRRFLDGRPVLARRPSPWNRAGRWARRHRPLVATAAAVGLLALGAGLVILSLAARNQTHALARRLIAYARDVNQASQAERRGALSEAASLLARHLPPPGAEDDRTFPWRYLWRITHPRPRVLAGHVGDVYRLEYAPDGQTLATAGEDGTARLWDAATAAPIRVLRGHESEVDCVTFSPDGRRLATAGDDGAIRLWSALKDEPSILVGRFDCEVVSVVFTPDGRELITGDAAGRVQFWDATTGLPKRAAPALNARVECLAIAPDGRTLAVAAAAPGVRLINVQEPQRATDLHGFSHVRCVAFSHDGRFVAAGDQRGTVKITTVGAEPPRSWAMARPTDLLFGVEGLTFSPNDRVVAAVGKGGHLHLWDVETGRLLGTRRSGRPRLWSVAFSPDGRTLAACGADGAVELWDPATAPNRETMLPPLTIHAASPVLLSRESLTVAVGGPSGPRRLTTWDLLANRPAAGRAWELPPCDLVVPSPDGQAAALLRTQGNPPVRLVTSNGQTPPPLVHPPNLPSILTVADARLVFSADGAQLAARLGHWVVVWEVATGRARATIHCKTAARSIAFSPLGDRLALVGDDFMRIHHLDTGAIDIYPDARLSASIPVVFTPDGHKLAVGHPNVRALAIWDLDDHQAMPTALEVVDAPRVMAVSPDGKTLAFGDDLGKISLVDLTTLAPIASLGAPRDPARALAFTPDGSALLGLFAPDAGTPVIVTAWSADPAPTTHLGPIDFNRR